MQTSSAHNTRKHLLWAPTDCCTKNHNLLFVLKLTPISLIWQSLTLVLKEPVNSQSLSSLYITHDFMCLYHTPPPLLAVTAILAKKPYHFSLYSSHSIFLTSLLPFSEPFAALLSFGDQAAGKPSSLIRYLSVGKRYCLRKRGMLTTSGKKMLVL